MHITGLVRGVSPRTSILLALAGRYCTDPGTLHHLHVAVCESSSYPCSERLPELKKICLWLFLIFRTLGKKFLNRFER
jgi:hypothetical protein